MDTYANTLHLLTAFALTASLITCQEERNDSAPIQKCCDVMQTLDNSGLRCVGETGVPNRTFTEEEADRIFSAWMLPGEARRELRDSDTYKRLETLDIEQEVVLRHEYVITVGKTRGLFVRGPEHPHRDGLRLVVPVNETLFWDPSGVANPFRPGRAVFEGSRLVRPRLHGGTRKAFYCTDAALPPFDPYALVFKPECTVQDCVRKACPMGELLSRSRNGSYVCVQNERGWWTPFNSTNRLLDPETPYDPFTPDAVDCEDGLFRTWSMSEDDPRFWKYLETRTVHNLFSTWETYGDFELLANGDVREVLGYCESSRRTRGVYRICRPLTFVTILLLVVALTAIGTKPTLRRSDHGKCLACHGSCLLLYNVGQVGYYLTMSEDIDSNVRAPSQLLLPCEGLGFTMYFLLTAAGFWLSAVCINMSYGFRRTQGVRSRSKKSKTFLKLSAFAWGTPVLLTSVSMAVYYFAPGEKTDESWYRPTLVETRTCFTEIGVTISSGHFTKAVKSNKAPTAVYYYAPLCFLVALNSICLGLTASRVNYLRRGNSVLRREQDEQRRGRAAAANPRAPQAPPGGAGAKRQRAPSEPKSLLVYIKLLLSAGLLEIVTEIAAWGSSHFHAMISVQHTFLNRSEFYDHFLAYRTAGYLVDLFRAGCVLWLAAPERRDVIDLWSRCRSKVGVAPLSTATKSTGLGGDTSVPSYGPKNSNGQHKTATEGRGPRNYREKISLKELPSMTATSFTKDRT